MARSTKVEKKTHLERLKEELADGEFHARNDLMGVLNCKTVPILHVVVSGLRKKIPEGELIICELLGRVIGYRWVKRKP